LYPVNGFVGNVCVNPGCFAAFVPHQALNIPQIGCVAGVFCRGQVEILSLSWDKQKIKVRMKSGKEQKLVLAMPSEIKTIVLENGIGQIDNGENKNERVVSLMKDNIVTFQIEI
jgi:hypothetical protein